MYAAYKEKADFFLIYIREAHPTDARPGADGQPGGPGAPPRFRGPDIKQPKTTEERVAAATACVQDLKITLPTLIDDMQGTAERAYGGWPDRIAVIDAGGKIAFHSDRGPAGFKPALAERALKDLLAGGGKTPQATPPAPESPAPAPPKPPG